MLKPPNKNPPSGDIDNTSHSTIGMPPHQYFLILINSPWLSKYKIITASQNSEVTVSDIQPVIGISSTCILLTSKKPISPSYLVKRF